MSTLLGKDWVCVFVWNLLLLAALLITQVCASELGALLSVICCSVCRQSLKEQAFLLKLSPSLVPTATLYIEN